MSNIYVIRNNMTATYGTPFVCHDDDAAMYAVCEGAKGANLASCLASSDLLCIGVYDVITGDLSKCRKKVVANSTKLLQFSTKFFENFEHVLADSIKQLELMRDYFKAKNETEGGVCGESTIV